MAEIITSADQLTAGRLTETLLRNGHLRQGIVTEIFVETFQSFFADFYRMDVTYSDDARPARGLLLPWMILKVPFADNEQALYMGREEREAYLKLPALMSDPPFPQCLDTFLDEGTGRSQILLEDISATHFRGDTPEDISHRQWELGVEALAALHSFWWESPSLGAGIGKLLDDEEIERITKLHEESLPKFFSALGGDLSPQVRTAYEKTFAFLPHFWRERLMSRRRNTLIHGDAHSWNLLFPRDAENGRVFLIDLATLRVRPATNDLAYLMAMKWKPERRARFEMPLLKYYHQCLRANGVRDFSWEDCLLDYRYSILTHMTTPVVQCGCGFLSPGIWKANFQRIFAAYEELGCEELLG